MAVFRVQKTRDYTIMSNAHLKDKGLSLKAKGLLSVMLSLPDEWDYSIDGLVAISKENETSIKSTLKELKEHGYLVVTKVRTEKGTYDYIYDIFERPGVEKPGVENLGVDNPPVENQGQLITKESNTKELITKDINKGNKKKEVEHKDCYGEFNHVKLTKSEYESLIDDYGEGATKRAIKYLDEYIEDKGDKYKSHNMTMRRWVFDAVREQEQKRARLNNQAPNKFTNFPQNHFDMDELEKQLLDN